MQKGSGMAGNYRVPELNALRFAGGWLDIFVGVTNRRGIS